LSNIISIILLASITYYDPSTCGVSKINCFDPNVWWRMSAGHDARNYYGMALACPKEFPLESIWIIPYYYGGPYCEYYNCQWSCLDRGDMVITKIDDDGNIIISLDLLVNYPIVHRNMIVRYVGVIPQQIIDRREYILNNKIYKDKK